MRAHSRGLPCCVRPAACQPCPVQFSNIIKVQDVADAAAKLSCTQMLTCKLRILNLVLLPGTLLRSLATLSGWTSWTSMQS